MEHRMKAKKLYSATLTHTWPKPIFPYKGSLGHLPVAAQPYVFVSSRAKDRVTGFYKVVPEMLYSIQANRQPVPKHEVLEDDYRAFHNVTVNQLALNRQFNRQNVDFNTALWSGRIDELKDHLPELVAYNPGCPAPPGYMYQRFKQARRAVAEQARAASRPRLTCPPVVVIRGPFQDMVRVNTPNFTDKVKNFDSAVIGRPRGTEIRIYNEPDAISTLAVDADFSRPLSERAKRACTVAKPNTRTSLSN